MSSFKGGVAGVGRSINRDVRQVTFQSNFKDTFGHRLENISSSIPSSLSTRAEEHCHTMNVGRDSTRVQDGSAADVRDYTSRQTRFKQRRRSMFLVYMVSMTEHKGALWSLKDPRERTFQQPILVPDLA